MSDEIFLENPHSRAVKRIAGGFDWPLFLLAGLFGIPLFWRGLYRWGAVFVALWLVDIALVFFAPERWSLAAQALIALVFFALQLWLGFYGGSLTVKSYVARGWKKRERAPRPKPRQGRRRRP